MLSVDSQQKIKSALITQGVLTTQSLQQAEGAAQKAGKPLFAYMIDQKVIDNEILTKVTAETSGVQYVNLQEAHVPKTVLAMLPKAVAEQYMAVPIGELDGGRIALAMLDPSNFQAVDYMSQKIGHPVAVFMASQDGISKVLGQYRTDVESDVKNAIERSIATGEAEDEKLIGKSAEDEAKSIASIVQDSPITRALKAILDYSVEVNASDVHIEPMRETLKIRIRVDGVMREIMALPKKIEPALVSRVKILSNLKIDQHATPQDGQFHVESKGKEVDIRVSISPVVWGEQIVLRLLFKNEKELNLQDLGFRGRAMSRIQEGIEKPYGMILATGPTGSGKSTSLYTLVNMIKNDAINVVTLEDPVERKMEGVNQIQVNSHVGLTFSSGLRSILRQDPDVILVGEVRDKETASLAVQAALTGHLVLATLHTNTAAGVLPRLLDMDVEPFLIASTINTVIGQRLVRRLAPNKVPRAATPAEVRAINKTVGDLLPKSEGDIKPNIAKLGYENLPVYSETSYSVMQGVDAEDTPLGYKGRMGIYEVFNMSEDLERILLGNGTTSQIQEQAEKEGMMSMRRDGYLKALMGRTTLEEVERVAAEQS